MAGLVKLNDPAGELSANYAQQRKKYVAVAIGAANSQIWDAIRKKKQTKRQQQKIRKKIKRPTKKIYIYKKRWSHLIAAFKLSY